MENQRYIIAVDCDGTLWTNQFPEIGEIREEHANLIQYIRIAHDFGAIICMWTCRVDNVRGRNYLTEAVEYCQKNNIPIDYINDSPTSIGYEDFKPRKIFADEYIDDRATNIMAFKDPTFINRRLKNIKGNKIKDTSLNTAWLTILKNLNLSIDSIPMDDNIDDSTRILMLSKILQERAEKSA